jgi:EF hand
MLSFVCIVFILGFHLVFFLSIFLSFGVGYGVVMLVALDKCDIELIEEIRLIFQSLDRDGNGTLDKEDFVEIVQTSALVNTSTSFVGTTSSSTTAFFMEQDDCSSNNTPEILISFQKINSCKQEVELIDEEEQAIWYEKLEK